MRDEMEELHIEFEHENNCNYLKLEIVDDHIEDYQTTMLNKNKIDHFLRFEIRKINAQAHVYYDISSKQQITKLFEYGKLTIKDVKQVCRNLSEMVRLTKNYMLDLDRVLVDARYMYMDMFDKSIWFLYLPEALTRDFSLSIRRLFEYILEHFDHSSGKTDVVQLYELYQHILVGDYDPENFMLLFHDGSGEEKEFAEDQAAGGLKAQVEKITESEECRKNKVETIVEAVPKETVVNEEEIENPLPEKILHYSSIGLVVVMIYGLVNLFLPQYIPVHIPGGFSMILIVVTAILYAGVTYIKKQDIHFRKFIRIPKEIAYRIEEVNDKEHGLNQESTHRNHTYAQKRTCGQRRTIVTDITSCEESDSGDCDEIEMRNFKEDNGDDEQWSNTMLLSDYLKKKSEKQKKLKMILLQILDDEQQEWNQDKWNQEEWNQQAEVVPDKYPYVIGSMPELANLVLNVPFISRMHACLQKKDSTYVIEDLNSTNGTYVNEIRVEGGREEVLKDGDILRMGMLSYKVEIS